MLDVGFIGLWLTGSIYLYGIESHVTYFLFGCRMMGSLGDVIKVQAQYNWVGKPNCIEVLHLLLWGNCWCYWSYFWVTIALNLGILGICVIYSIHLIHWLLATVMTGLWVCECLGVCLVWLHLGFWVFKVDFRVIYGFWGWIYECEGVTSCFMGFWVSLGVPLGFRGWFN